MTSIISYADGIQTVFPTPASLTNKTVKVNGVLATIASQTPVSVTMVAPPAAGATVEIIHDSGIIAASPALLLAASAVAVSVTGTTNETTLATVTIPGGAMGINGGLLIYATWSYTNSANNKTPRIRLGGVSGTAVSAAVLTTSAAFHDIRRVRNRNSASSQVTGTSSATTSPLGITSGAVTTAAVDTSVAQDLVISGQLALGTETLTLESYEVWLLP